MTRVQLQQKEWRRTHKDYLKSYAKVWYYKNHQRSLAIKKRSYDKRRNEVFNRLGTACACCGESLRGFLQIDHIQPSPQRSPGVTLGEVERSGYDRTKYRILCANCNIATRFSNPCPHNAEEVKAFFEICRTRPYLHATN